MTGKKQRFSDYFYNPITFCGVVLAGTVAALEVSLFAIDFIAHGRNQYLGLLTYILLPPFLILGLLLIAAGAWRRRRRIIRGLESVHPWKITFDPTKAHHRNALFVFVTGTVAFLVMTAVGAYKGFQYTESVEFCGTLCHSAMHPEFTTHERSPHARVDCVACHVGGGADWYVRSKLTGARQLVRYATGTYARPIDTPVRDLRSSIETCGKCHWPDKPYNTYDLKRDYFTSESGSEPWKLRMLLQVGGRGGKSGVHAHMNVEQDVYYVADEKRENIFWVKSVDKAGRETIYTSEDSPYRTGTPPVEKIRKMDCVDCHNRPAHRYEDPAKLVNEAMASGRIDPGIPDIKAQAVAVLEAEDADAAAAAARIEKALKDYYSKNNEDYYAKNADKIAAATGTLQELYRGNIFPHMKARWSAYPDHVSHLNSAGCFRCHDGAHVSSQGKVITRDCNACHTIIEQGTADNFEKNLDGLEFRHPVDIGDAWKETNCSDCHTGGAQ